MTVLSQEALIGAWELVAWQNRVGDQVINPLGERPRGVLIYTPDGWLSVHIMGPERTAIPSVDPLGGSESERAAAYAGYLAYCGRYEIHDDRVVHKIELSLFPNWVGAEQSRFVDLSDDELTLRTPPIESPDGVVVSELRWRRPAREEIKTR